MFTLHRRIELLLFIAIAVMLGGCSGRTAYEKAEAAARNGDYKTAIQLFTELAKTSKHPGVFVNRANCYSYIGELEAALADYQKALDLIKTRSPNANDPVLAMVYYNRGYAYNRAKKYNLAVPDYEKTIEINPDYPDVKNSLAWLLSTCPDARTRNPKRAIELANEALRSAPEDPRVLDTVAACYAAAGDFARATATQEKAVSLCRDPALMRELDNHLLLYRNKKPFIETE